MQPRDYQMLAQLRVIIGFLGERDHAGWWPSGFCTSSSTAFLAPAFPRSLTPARYEGLCRAAQHVHDEHVGTGDVFHLFRLPEDMEQALHDALRSPTDPGISVPGNWEEGIAHLEQLSVAIPTASEGPVRIGSLEEARSRKTWTLAAGHYLNAFATGKRTHPYLAAR